MKTETYSAEGFSAKVAELILELERRVPFAAQDGCLSRIASLCGADGVVLWLKIEGTRDNQRIFSAASWSSEPEQRFFRYLSQDSPTFWQAVKGGPTNYKVSPYLALDPNHPDAKAAAELKIRTMCSIPVEWNNSSWGEEGTRAGVVNFFRRGDTPFSDEAFENAKLAGRLVLPLLSNISIRSAFELLKAVARELRPSSEYQAKSEVFSRSLKRKLDPVVQEVSSSLGCLEVSIYLEDPKQIGEGVELVSSQWPWTSSPRSRYVAGFGLTG